MLISEEDVISGYQNLATETVECRDCGKSAKIIPGDPVHICKSCYAKSAKFVCPRCDGACLEALNCSSGSLMRECVECGWKEYKK
jgi:Zn ribbon nucleic-acid-binding protein